MDGGVKYQGNVTVASRDTAEWLAAVTEWPKYLAYEVVIRLATRLFRKGVPDLTKDEPTVWDAVLTHQAITGVSVTDFRGCYRTQKNTHFFKRALHVGAYFIDGLKGGTLPQGVSSDTVLQEIRQILGTSSAYYQGLDLLEALVKNPVSADVEEAALTNGHEVSVGSSNIKSDQSATGMR